MYHGTYYSANELTLSQVPRLQLMALVSVAMVMVAMGMSSLSGLSRALREPAMLNHSMLRAMAIDAFDPAVRSSFAAMQAEVGSLFFTRAERAVVY